MVSLQKEIDALMKRYAKDANMSMSNKDEVVVYASFT